MSILAEILQHKRETLAAQLLERPLDKLRAELKDLPPCRDFSQALQQPRAVIAEIKRRSPSRGELRPRLDPVTLAQDYAVGGAAALSVLTDERYFGMQPAELGLARAACGLPVLRKDFIIDEYMVYESRLLGADALLLIVAALEDDLLHELLALSEELGMVALVETHDEREVERALAAGASIVGINARNLATFEVDLDTVRRVAGAVPPDVLLVAESGIKSRGDIDSLRVCGAHAFLIGESLLSAPDPRAALAQLTALEAAV